MSIPAAEFYQTGGTLGPGAPCYVRRQADADLHAALIRGEFCYMLTSNQMGKSSLMLHTDTRLRGEGVDVVRVDLTAVGANVSPEQWYRGLLVRLPRQLYPMEELERFRLEEELEQLWLETHLGALQRWMTALERVVLPRTRGRLVIFIDEIGGVRNLPFSTSEFFAAIRECSNRRGAEPERERLTFCLLGAATPSELIADVRNTPFNIGKRIELTDFTADEAAPLAHGLGRPAPVAKALLQQVLYWTGGHPYLTQRFCQEVAEDLDVTNPRGVDRVCESLFLSPRAREEDSNLFFVRERLLRSETDVPALLELYTRVRRGARVRDGEANPYIDALLLSGIVRALGGYLHPRNRIYDQAFNEEWIAKQLARAPGSAREEREPAQPVSEAIADQPAERGARPPGEGCDLGLLRLLQEHRNAVRLHQAPEETWRRWARRYELVAGRLATVAGHAGPVLSLAFSPDGKLLATGSSDNTARLWDARTWTPHDGPLQHGGGVAALAFSPNGRLLLTGSLDGTARPWNTVTDRPDGHGASALTERRLMTRLWNTATGQSPRQPLGHPAPVRAVAFSPSGMLVATGWGDQAVRLWRKARAGAAGDALPHKGAVTAAAFSPDGTLLATAAEDGTTRLWLTQTGEPCCTLSPHRSAVRSVAFSRDGGLLATASEDKTVRLWHTATAPGAAAPGQPCGEPLQHSASVLAVAFSPDGTLLATGAQDGTVRLWDMKTRQPLGEPLRHQAPVVALAFHPHGPRLATASWDRTARIWETRTSAGPARQPPPGALRPADLRRMELRTWVALGARLNAQGIIEAIPWEEWQRLRQELATHEPLWPGGT